MSLLLAIVGFACLATAMNRHHSEVIGGRPSRARARLLRVAGTVALLALLSLDMSDNGAAFGVLIAFGYASVGSGIVSLALTSLARLRVPR